jgi:hypothetical protein
VATGPGEIASAINARRERKVVVVAMSRGGIAAAAALAAGAKPSGVAFVSANGTAVMRQLGSPARLPATLIVHHTRDGCAFTAPDAIQRFAAWSQGRARLQWIDNSGPEAANPCGPLGAHGFYRQDGPAIAAIIGFIRAP